MCKLNLATEMRFSHIGLVYLGCALQAFLLLSVQVPAKGILIASHLLTELWLWLLLWVAGFALSAYRNTALFMKGQR